MNDSSNIIPSEATLQEEEIKPSYSNRLFQNIQPQQLTEENFSLYKKDLANILLNLVAQTKFIASQIASVENMIINLKRPGRIDNTMAGAEHRSHLLSEYCEFFRNLKGKVPLPYEYLGAIAHNFKTAIAAIKMRLSESNRQNWESIQENLKETKDIMDHVIKGVLDAMNKVSHIEFQDNTLYQPMGFFPCSIIDDKIKLQTPLIQEKKIVINNALQEYYSINSYKEIFEIVIGNLLSNAVKFTPPQGEIDIGIANESERDTTFFVKNSGVGIPEGVDVFKRGYTTPSTEGQQGTGLGLTQCKTFLEIIRGEISYRNISNQGTIFYFIIPKKSLAGEQ